MWQRWNGTSKILEYSTDNGANWNPLPLNASILTEGLINDARMGLSGFSNYTPTVTGMGATTITIVGSASGYYRTHRGVLEIWIGIQNFTIGVAASQEIHASLPPGMQAGLGLFNAAFMVPYWQTALPDWVSVLAYLVAGQTVVRFNRTTSLFAVGTTHYLYFSGRFPLL